VLCCGVVWCTQLDLRHSKHWQMQQASPDVLITPSRLAPMAKEVLGSLVVNPGPLAKGARGGSYATLSVNPLPPAPAAGGGDEGEEGRPHEVAARTHVTICKI
jgi:DNA polymerase alpha subunit B